MGFSIRAGGTSFRWIWELERCVVMEEDRFRIDGAMWIVKRNQAVFECVDKIWWIRGLRKLMSDEDDNGVSVRSWENEVQTNLRVVMDGRWEGGIINSDLRLQSLLRRGFQLPIHLSQGQLYTEKDYSGLFLFHCWYKFEWVTELW